MSEVTQAVTDLINQFAKLPGIGEKSAERLTYHVLRVHKNEALALADAIRSVKENVRYCSNCYNLAEEELCDICQDPRRDAGRALRRRAAARPDGAGADGRVSRAVSRVAGPDRAAGRHRSRPTDDRRPGRAGSRRAAFKEVIMATNPTVEGDGTALYISNLLAEISGENHPARPRHHDRQRARIC